MRPLAFTVPFTDSNDRFLCMPFHILQLVKLLPIHIPEAWQRYPFRAEYPRIGPYMKYPPWTCTLKKSWGKMDHGHGGTVADVLKNSCMPVYWFPVAAHANSVGTFQVTIVKLATYPKQCWIIYCAKWVEISLFRVTTLSRGRVGEWRDEPKADPKLCISSRVVLRRITWKGLSTVLLLQ